VKEALAPKPLTTGRTTVAQPAASSASAKSTRSPTKGSSQGKDSATAPPPSVPQVRAPAAALEDPSAAGNDPRARNDVKCYKGFPKDGGRPYIVIEMTNGRKFKFDQKFVEFELRCQDLQALTEWLNGIETPFMPGLLTLLADEVKERGDELKKVKQEYDVLRGEEDYRFFGLDGAECTDKDIDRAYRQLSTKLHPDKGGDEKSFQDMKERYEQLKTIRSEKEDWAKEGSGTIKWDPRSRESMLEAHTDLRAQLLFISKEIIDISKQVVELQQRSRLRRCLPSEAADELLAEEQSTEAGADSQPEGQCSTND